MTYKIIAGAAAIGKAIDSIKTRGAKLDKDIQIAALSAMQHHIDHGDVTLVNRLVKAMPKGMRGNSLKAFIETFGACKYCEERKEFVHVKGKNNRMPEAHKIMWVEFKPEAEYTSVDPAKFLQSAIARMKADVAKMGDKSLVSPELIAGLQALADLQKPEIAH